MNATERARAITSALARAESLAQLCRDHGHPARVVVGRKRGTVRIRAASMLSRGARRPRAEIALLPVCRTAVRDWLGY